MSKKIGNIMQIKFFRLWCTITFLCFSLFSVGANETVEFTAQAPNTAVVGVPFQLVYSVNNKRAKDLVTPVLKDFEVLAGPFSSSYSSMEVVNGKMTSSVQIKYTYTLMARKVGNFQIGPGSIVIKSKKYHSNAVTIKVLPEDKSAKSNQGASSSQGSEQSSNSLSKENLFVRAEVSDKKVYENEAVYVAYKLYTRVSVADLQNVKMPEFEGFVVQDIEMPKGATTDREHYNNLNYNVITLKKQVIFPQHAGTYTIPAFKTDAIVRVRSTRRSQSIFDMFDSYQNVTKHIESTPIKITVSALPSSDKPKSFSGAVGHFSLKSELSSTELKTNESLMLKYTLTGTGNLKTLQLPKVTFPADFETYDPKLTNKLTPSISGLSGTKTVEYLIIPRHHGTFEIPTMVFSYFDIKSKSYKTLTTPSYTVVVNKGDENEAVVSSGGASFVDKEAVRALGSDIRYIHNTPLHLKKYKDHFAGSSSFWLIFILTLFMGLVFGLLFSRQIKASADVARTRNKRASRVAKKRFKIAEKELKLGHKKTYYDELLKAVWGYLCDKLNMPLSDLNKENVSSALMLHQVKEPLVETFIALLNECEFEQYAPNIDSSQAMDAMYAKMVKIITQLDQAIK